MKLQRLLSLVRKSVDDYQMISAGDRIAIGISGGKDSLALLFALHELQRFYPFPFELCAFTVDLGFGIQDFKAIQALCDDFSIPYTVISTDIAKIVFETRRESNPCSLCAKMRKGALNQQARSCGCNKVAYAHHRDDIIETMMLSLIYEGRFYTFSPRTYLDRMDLTVIRPMMYVSEADIIGFKNKYQLLQKSMSGGWKNPAGIRKKSHTGSESGKSWSQGSLFPRGSLWQHSRLAISLLGFQRL